MTFNSQDIIQDTRAEFEHLLEFVTGEQARTAKADNIERGLFKMLLSLGAKLLQLFFTMRSEICSRQPVQDKSGQELPYHRDTKRVYFSIFNKVFIERPYFYKQGVGTQTPLDAELGLGNDSYSDMLREVTEYLAIYHVYGGKKAGFLERLFGFNLSTRALQQNVAEDSEDVEGYYAQKSPPCSESEAEILVIQADGKGIPMVLEEDEVAEVQVRLGKGQKHGHKKEAIVTTVYTIAAMPRTPAEVIASFFAENEPEKTPKKASKPQNKHIWATLDGKDVALSRLAKQVALREGEHFQHRVALCDGCEALQSRIALQFQGFILILDFVHANEYLWDVANCLLGETSEKRLEWVKSRTLQILSGQTEQVIAELRQIAKYKKRKCRKEHNSTKQPTTSSVTCLICIPKLICPMGIPSHRRARLKALVAILLKTALNSLACAGFKQVLKTYCAYALWLKTKIGTRTMPIAENNDNSVYMANLHRINNPSKPTS